MRKSKGLLRKSTGIVYLNIKDSRHFDSLFSFDSCFGNKETNFARELYKFIHLRNIDSGIGCKSRLNSSCTFRMCQLPGRVKLYRRDEIPNARPSGHSPTNTPQRVKSGPNQMPPNNPSPAGRSKRALFSPQDNMMSIMSYCTPVKKTNKRRNFGRSRATSEGETTVNHSPSARAVKENRERLTPVPSTPTTSDSPISFAGSKCEPPSPENVPKPPVQWLSSVGPKKCLDKHFFQIMGKLAM